MSQKSLFKGDCLRCTIDDGGIINLCFDNQKASVNKFDEATLKELRTAVDAIKKEDKAKGLLLSSAKDVFIVGADITEFLSRFQTEDSVMETWLGQTHKLFSEIEDLPYPTVCLINGVCLGGGFEVALTTAFRIASTQAQVGLPETKLGIYPGWGGTIRLPRLTGTDNAIEWIAGGGTYSPADALKVGAVDAVVEQEKLFDSGLNLLHEANIGKLNWKDRQDEKRQPLKIVTQLEAMMAFETAKGFVAGKAGKHYPAPLEAIAAMQESAGLTRDQASPREIKGFIKVAKSETAESLVTIFLSDQFNKKKSKETAKAGKPIKRSAVLGAGIMGGGIAFQSASRGVPILMKDITEPALTLGLTEASKLFGKLVERGKIDPTKMAQGIASITPTMSYGDIKGCQIVVEAIVENEGIKKKVLSELEAEVAPGTIIASNTSTIRIDKLATALKKPELFCGMHFFNPVPKMPLVEVIKGEKTSNETLATVVAYAQTMGKTPIVVKDCPGFLVNRILFPYFFGFVNLITDGVEFKQIDKVMEKYGWPMGPAYLLDVVGIDTSVHASQVMATAFPERMRFDDRNVLTLLNQEKRFGQKNGKGFYSYTLDKRGSLKKQVDPTVDGLVKTVVKNTKTVSDQEIIDRMMIPMINEAALCLEENIVATPMELDLALIYGIGFPPFRGGLLKDLDRQGLSNFVKNAEKYASLGTCYQTTNLIKQKAQKNQRFYQP